MTTSKADIRYVAITLDHCEAVASLIKICFPDMKAYDQYSAEELAEMVELYPDGTVIALDGNRPIGMGTGIFTDIDFDNLPQQEHDLLYDAEDKSRHDWTGDYYYGSDLAVHPDYRGRGIARQIYKWRKQQVIEHNKKGFVAAAVLPGYEIHRSELSIHDYVAQVVAGELFDPTLSVQLRNDFRVIKLLHKFFEFPRSDDWSALIIWENPHYVPSVS